MLILNVSETGELWLNSTENYQSRVPSHEHDWGDNNTIGIKITNGELTGKYLGKLLVGVCNENGLIISGELFGSLEEMRKRWTFKNK